MKTKTPPPQSQVETPLSNLKLLIFAMMALLLSLYAYYGGFFHPFRSDMYLAYNFFDKLSFNLEGIKTASRFEMFGHRRIMPLSHILMFCQYKILGMNHVLHHLLQYLLHLFNSLLLYFLIFRLLKNRVAAVIGSALFLLFYSHFDIINWTYHTFVILSCTALLGAFILILKYFENRRIIYILLAVPLLFSAQLVYESNVLLPLWGLVFFYILLRQSGSPLAEFKTALWTFVSGVFLCYTLFAAIFFIESARFQQETNGLNLKGRYIGQTAPLVTWKAAERLGITRRELNRISGETNGDVEMAQMLTKDHILTAFSTAFTTIFDTVLIKGFGFPSEIKITDIIYLNRTQLEFASYKFILASLACFIFLASFRLSGKAALLVLLFLAVSYTHVYIIALGRVLTAPPDYVPSQPHYVYFPNLMYIIVVSILLDSATRFNGKKTRLVLAAAMLIAVINTLTIHDFTARTTESLADITSAVGDIKKFSQNRNQLPIFINFPVYLKTRSFNLGSDIAPYVYFKNQGIITQQLTKAKYLYDRGGKFDANPLYGRQNHASDFSIEFLYFQQHTYNINEFSLVCGKGSAWWLEVDQDGHLLLYYDELGNPAHPIPKMSYTGIRMPRQAWHYIIVQRQENVLYILLDGEIKFALDVKNTNISLQGKQMADILGGFYSGAGAVTFSNRFFTKTGMVNYDLAGKTTGDVVAIPQVETPW
ncbi:MAG: hypothetical protein HZA78_08700 [Candidatus Schekmanbacteria bacterium]|nr:hypothetical protein [Candidatus Schekmanbacteria bacterium]